MTADSTSRATFSSSFKSLPKTFMPTGVLIPVESMSILAFIGIVHAFVMPGRSRAESISSMSLSVVMPGRHSSMGFRFITVSNISKGAGSVAVSALPASPKTLSTSGKLLIILSCVWSISAAFVTETPGSVTGM